jgi:4-hydroxy-tetrahydrodipicolinate synthase
VTSVEGISSITVNAHASEAHACTFQEQQRVLDITLDENGTTPVVNGIYADGSALAAQLAKMAEKGGASALLVFPPNSIAMGGQLRPEMALSHFKVIADATDLPLIIFQYPLGGGLGHTFDTLVKLCEDIPSVVAIKDWCNDAMLHEKHIRVLQNLTRPINVLTTHSAWLMSSLVMGCNGLLSGAGSVIADLQVALWLSVQEGDLVKAKKLNDQIYPMVQAFYAPPFLDMHNRMKETAVLLGRLPKAIVRPPLCKLPNHEIENLKIAIKEAGLSGEGFIPRAA